MNIAVPRETAKGETRVALTPKVISQLSENGLQVSVEQKAGEQSFHTDESYREAGAEVVDSAEELYKNADLVVKVNAPDDHEISLMGEGTTLIAFLWSLHNRELVDKLCKAKITAIGMEALPRISLAQKMDALSAMSSIAGYKSVLLGANAMGKYMPMMVTAAGTVPPAKVLVIGAGVAGLQAIATAKRLGAVVQGYDIRPEVREQIKSLGAEFVEVPLEEDGEAEGGYAREVSKETQEKQRQVMHDHVAKADMVITTALVPGKRAPVLVDGNMVDAMAPGSVIVDLAAEQGGNCERTRPGEDTVTGNGVTVRGPLNVPSRMPIHASQLYARTLQALLMHIIREGSLTLDFEDPITQAATITHEGKVVSTWFAQQES